MTPFREERVPDTLSQHPFAQSRIRRMIRGSTPGASQVEVSGGPKGEGGPLPARALNGRQRASGNDYFPVPFSATVCVPSASVTLKVALSAPAAEGVKVML